MRVSFYSNSCHVPSGYGQQAAQVVHRLVKSGHQPALISNHGAAVMMNCAHGHPIFPEGLLKYSGDAAPQQMKQWAGPDGIGIILFDAWALMPWSDNFAGLKTAVWAPIDHTPATPASIEFLKAHDRHAIAMSRHGEREMLKAGLSRDRVSYIPHAIETMVFNDKGRGIRKDLGVPDDAHLSLMVAANRGRLPIRKAFAQNLQAWWNVAKDHPEMYLLLHTEPLGLSEGMNLPRFINQIGADAQRVRYPEPNAFRNGIPNEALAAIYSAADCLLASSYGEGYGVPTVESQACGTPVIVGDGSAQPELCGPHGKIVDGYDDWDEYQAAFWRVPSVASITQALEENYQETKAGKVDRAAIVAWAQQYDADKIFADLWVPFIQKFASQPASGQPLNRAARRAKR